MSNPCPPVTVLLIQLDQSVLTFDLIGKFLKSFKCVEKLNFKSIQHQNFVEHSIIELARQGKDNSTYINFSKESVDLTIPTVFYHDKLPEQLPTACALIFCGHSKHSGGLTQYLNEDKVKDIIHVVSPTVVSFFGCDVGRPRDGDIFALSHSHQAYTGPIYSAFVRKVTVDNVMNSSLMYGILQFAAQCCDSSNTNVTKYDLARHSFAAQIALRDTQGDSGLFFNDTRKETTVQVFMNLSQDSRLVENDKRNLQDIARYHWWTVDKSTCVNALLTTLKRLFSSGKLKELDKVLNQALVDLEISLLKKLENRAKNMDLSEDIITDFAKGGDLKSIPYDRAKGFCAAIYNGFFGNESFSNIVSLIISWLLLATSKEQFELIAAVLILTDESWYLAVENETFYLRNCRKNFTVRFLDEKVLLNGYFGASAIVTPLGTFDPESFLSSFIPLYCYCVYNPNFKNLYNNETESITLQCGASLTKTFDRNMSPRLEYSFTRDNFLGILKAVRASVRHIASLKKIDCVDNKRINSLPADQEGIETKEFSILRTDNGRFKCFPGNLYPQTGQPVPLWFMEVYPLPKVDLKKLYRCRFVVGLPERLLTDTIKNLNNDPSVEGIVYYTDNHYGQDVYAAGKKSFDIEELNIDAPNNYGWTKMLDFAGMTLNMCNQKKFFPFEFIGVMRFSLTPDDDTIIFGEQTIPVLSDYDTIVN